MRLAFLVNDLATEHPRYTTTRLALEAIHRGHEVWYVDVEGFFVGKDDTLRLSARPARGEPEDGEALLESLREAEESIDAMTLDELDVLMLRNDPAGDEERPWAGDVGITFGQMARERGVLVLNDPTGLAHASSKLYLHNFPSEVRPRTMVSRDPGSIRDFLETLGGEGILKPLRGSGGQSVFLVRKEDDANRNQMIEAVLRGGYVIVQEYLPADGDTRLFLMNGEPLQVDGKYGALRRVNQKGDVRSNMHAGGKAEKAEIGEEELRVAQILRPRLVDDGMFLVGIDLVGGKVLEINVFSPGGLNTAEHTTGACFAGAVIEAIERKVAWRDRSPSPLTNARLATL